MSFIKSFKSSVDALLLKVSELINQQEQLRDHEKLILRDVKQGMSWVFYLANSDGTYTDAMTYDDVMPKYQIRPILRPELANAVVKTSNGLLVRKGLEDYIEKTKSFTKRDLFVLPPYRIPLDDPKAEQIATTKPEQDSITETDEIDTLQDDNKDFHIENGKLLRYTGHAESVTIPDGVKTVGSHAFSKNERIKTVFIPSTVKSIGMGAFEECENLEKVTMTEGVSKIGKDAFKFCWKLNSVTIPNGVVSIGKDTFAGCGELDSVVLPHGLISIGSGAFHMCGLRKIDIPGSVKNIEMLTFCDCNLLEITFHEGLETIDQNAFGGCEAVITIPNSVKHVDSRAFEDLLYESHVETIYYTGSEERAAEIGLLNLYGDIDVYCGEKSDED